MAIALRVDDVSKVYGPAGSHHFALDRITLTVGRGEFVARAEHRKLYGLGCEQWLERPGDEVDALLREKARDEVRSASINRSATVYED